MPGTGAGSAVARVGMAKETWQLETSKRTTWIKLTLTQRVASTRDQRLQRAAELQWLVEASEKMRNFWEETALFLETQKTCGHPTRDSRLSQKKPARPGAQPPTELKPHHVVQPSPLDVLFLVATLRVLSPIGSTRSVAAIRFGPHAPAWWLTSVSASPSADRGRRFHPPECPASASGGHHPASQPSSAGISSRGVVRPSAAESVAVRFE